MMQPPIRLPFASRRLFKHNLNGRHVTTTNFGELSPVYFRFIQPGDKIRIASNFTIRTQPLALPTYGSVQHKLHAFFVPMRLVYKYFNEFMQGQRVLRSTAYTPNLPRCSTFDLMKLFLDFGLYGYNGDSSVPSSKWAYVVEKLTIDDDSTITADEIPQGEFGQTDAQGRTHPSDFIVWLDTSFTGITEVTAGWYAFKLTTLGRYWLKVWNSLGYSWNWTTQATAHISVQLLTFGCFCKMYLDYFCPSQYVPSSRINVLLDEFQNWNVDSQPLEALRHGIESISLAYDNDYFTSAWSEFDSVVSYSNLSPNPNVRILASDMTGQDVNDRQNEVVNTSEVDGTVLNDVDANHGITAFGLRLLQSVENWMTRNNYAGSRAVERMFARFGIKVPDYRYQRSEYIGSDVCDFVISDVTNMAESADFDLGSYAGKMWAQKRDCNVFQYDATEYGFVIVVNTIMPIIEYYQGIDRINLCLDKFDFPTPEFDRLGNEAIAFGELFADFKVGSPNLDDARNLDLAAAFRGDEVANPNRVYGFAPRYSWAKISRSYCTGAYRVPTLAPEIEAFNLMRKFEVKDAANMRAQTSQMLYVDAKQYDRIFSVDENLSDEFFPSYFFQVSLLSRMNDISDSIPLQGEGEGVSDGNGSQIN